MSEQQAKILYIEDEPFLGKIVKESLESRGFLVRMLTDGAEAASIFQSFQPDICVLDIMLPTKDGLTVGKEIKKLAPQMPIIFLTAKSQTEDVIKGFKSGGNDYMRKPFSMEELIIRIQNLLDLTNGIRQEPTKLSSQVISIGQYTYDPVKYELTFREEVAKLSHREAELLRIFLENREEIVQRRYILKAIWGDDSFFNSRNLDVYITKLRGYFKQDPDIQIITLKGVGYRFVVG
jgi:DNA-binding response OmpR family regulator